MPEPLKNKMCIRDRYECDAVVDARRYLFHLLYYVEHQKWTVLWKSSQSI